jgi:hypothetical protein
MGQPTGAFLFTMRSTLRTIDPRSLGIAALLLIAATLRFSHADWDGGNQLHPDERAILFAASDLHIPENMRQALDAHQSPLNPFRAADGSPRLYPYGHLPLYLTVGMSNLLRLPCSQSGSCRLVASKSFFGRLLNVDRAAPYEHYTYIGRALSALFDLLTMITAFLLTRRLFTRVAALIAAAMYTFAVIHIQNAHFGTVDTALTFFSTLTILFLVLYIQTGRTQYTVLAGICTGLAFGSKASAIYLAVPILFTHLRFRPSVKLAHMEAFWLTFIATVTAFLITNPYSILDFVSFITSIVTQAQVTSGEADFPFTRQYSSTLPLIYPIEQQARVFLGIPLTVAIYAGLVTATITQYRQRSRPHTILIIWVATILLMAGIQYVKFPRYMLPALPIMYVLAGGMLDTVRLRAWQKLLIAFAILIPAAIYAVTFVQMYQSPHPWVAASEWIYTLLPPHTRVISELWDDPLPLDLVIDGEGYLREDHVDTVLIEPFAEPDDLKKIHTMSTEIAAADYIMLSSNRLYGVIPRLRERYPITSAYYQALFAEELGFELERSFSRYPNLFGISLVDDPLSWPSLPDPGIDWPEPALRIGHVDESFSIYDHPLVLVFRNTNRLSQSEIEAHILARVGSGNP